MNTSQIQSVTGGPDLNKTIEQINTDQFKQFYKEFDKREFRAKSIMK